MVLAGTDVRPLDDYHFTKKPPLAAGRYIAETGGATIQLIVRRVGSRWEIARTFSEPGATPKSRRYTALTRLADRSYQGKGILLRLPDEGGLVLRERVSGLAEIPAHFWIHYRPQ